jgi:O-antigen ligase
LLDIATAIKTQVVVHEVFRVEFLYMLKRIFGTVFFGAIKASNISLTFIGLLFFIPFINMHHMQPLPVFYSEWIAATLGLIAVFPLIIKASRQTVQIPQVSLIFVGLTAILCLQWALGMLHSNQYALLALSYLIWAFLLVILGSYLRRELGWDKLVSLLAWCLVIAGIVNIAIVALQFVVRTGGFIPFLPKLSSYGALAQSNHFGNFCALATASLIYLHAKERFSSSLFYLMLVSFMMMLSFSGSRSVWLYLTALTILLVVMHAKTVRQEISSIETQRAYRAGLLLIPLFIVVQLFIHYVIPNEYVALPTERLLDGVTANTASLRLHFWYDSFRMSLQSPWLGVGTGKFMASTFLLVDLPTTMATKHVYEHAHNLFFHLLAEMGLGAVLIVMAGLFAWVKSFKWRSLNLETWWLISLLAIIGIHSMLEYPLWFTFFLGITAVLLGAGEEKFITISFSKGRFQFARAGLTMLLILGFVNLSTLLVANAKLEAWLQKLVNEDLNDVAQLAWVKQNSLLSPHGQFMHVLAMSIDSKHLNDSLLLSQSVMNFKPVGIASYKHALLLKLKGKNTDAALQFNRAVIAYPDAFKVVLENAPIAYKQTYLDLHKAQQVSTNKLSKK